MFLEGRSIDEVVAATGRALSTVVRYLEDCIDMHEISEVTTWVGAETVQRVRAAKDKMGDTMLRPIFDHLNEEIPYDHIRIALAGIRNEPPPTAAADEEMDHDDTTSTT